MRPPCGVGTALTLFFSSSLGGELDFQILDHGTMLPIPMTCLTIWNVSEVRPQNGVAHLLQLCTFLQEHCRLQKSQEELLPQLAPYNCHQRTMGRNWFSDEGIGLGRVMRRTKSASCVVEEADGNPKIYFKSSTANSKLYRLFRTYKNSIYE
jgi:hypothetical protein